MLAKITKWLSIAAFLLAALWCSPTSYERLLQFLICVAAILVTVQPVRTGKYVWGIGFTAIAVLFNPVIPVALSHRTFFWLDLACLVAFVASLAALKTMPVMSIPSITARRSRTESL